MGTGSGMTQNAQTLTLLRFLSLERTRKLEQRLNRRRRSPEERLSRRWTPPRFRPRPQATP